MWGRLSVAFLLMLSPFFLTGGMPRALAGVVSAQQTMIRAEQPARPRHLLPDPAEPQLRAGAVGQHGLGGVAVPVQDPPGARPAWLAARSQGDQTPQPAASRSANPPRAPPHSTER